MTQRVIETQFGPASCRVHEVGGGWRAMLVGCHAVPWVPVLPAAPARSEAEAVDALVAAISRLAAFR